MKKEAQITYIIRHRRENLKKCSLCGLEEREGLHFFTYPTSQMPSFDGFTMLTLDEAPELSKEDGERRLVLLDGTWKLAGAMAKNLDFSKTIKRSLPKGIRTVYPRKQEDCTDPGRGLASVEALYISHSILEWEAEGLLDGYYWKKEFLELNKNLGFS